MRKSKLTALLALLILVGGWAFPVKDVAAVNPVSEEGVELTLTSAEVVVRQFDEIDPLDYVMTGTFDSLQHSIVDTTKVGPQVVTYIAQKGEATIKLNKVVRVLDSVGPEIEGDDTIELRFESDFVIESEYTAIDQQDGEVDVEFVGEIDRSVPGEYTAVIRATDSSDNTTTKEITVIIHEDPEVVALRERNEAYAELVSDANALADTLLADTSVSAIEDMLSRVNNALNYESDYQDELASLSSTLSSKKTRAQEFYAPEPVVETAAPVVQTDTPTVQQAPAPAPEPQVATPASSLGQEAVNIALQFVGYPYVWGGTSPSGFDCSGLTTYVYRQLGYSLPRTAGGQMYSGYAVSYPSVGDLVIYRGGGHVAIYMGNGQVVHALNPSDGIKVTDLYYVGTPSAYRRVLP